jgi:hypothetical protein
MVMLRMLARGLGLAAVVTARVLWKVMVVTMLITFATARFMFLAVAVGMGAINRADRRRISRRPRFGSLR